MKSKSTLIVCNLALLISGQASAAFYDHGNGMVYDSSLNITWMQDANLLGTQLAGNPNLVNQIIAANGGVVTDSLGSHTLSAASDFGTGGQVSWWGAKAYMNYLNSINYNGTGNWRLAANQPINGTSWPPSFGPVTYNGSSDFGYHILSPQSEMAYLYGVGLNHDSNALYTTTGANNPSWTVPSMSFQNAANSNAADSFLNASVGDSASSYWSNTESPYNSGQAWRFNFYSGGQLIRSKSHSAYYAWAVAPGNVAAVPVPAAIWLFGSSVAVFVGFSRRKSVQGG